MNYFINHYGEENQLNQLLEEALELALTLKHYIVGKDTIEHVIEEMADVSNLIDQFSDHWNDGRIYKVKHEKRVRQMERIKNGI